MKTEQLKEQINLILEDAFGGDLTATDRILSLLDSQRPKDESIEQRGKEYSEKAHADGFSTYAELQAAFIAGAESQDALRSEEVEQLKARIETLKEQVGQLDHIGCHKCGGSGFKDGWEEKGECPYCHGLGEITLSTKLYNHEIEFADLNARLSTLTAICDRMEEAIERLTIRIYQDNKASWEFNKGREVLAEYQQFKTEGK